MSTAAILPVRPVGVKRTPLHRWVSLHRQSSGRCSLPLASPPLFPHQPIFCSSSIMRWASAKRLSGPPEWWQAGPGARLPGPTVAWKWRRGQAEGSEP